MKKKSKILIACSMILMVLSITSICFTIAWYSVYPTVHNMSLTTGSESLEIHNSVFLRTRDGATGASMFTPAKNVKTVVGGKHMVNGVEVKANDQGEIICNFTDLNFSLFGIEGNTTDLGKGGILDETTMSWNAEHLTFALMECSFYNQYFPAYLSASYVVTVIPGANTTLPANFFSIRFVHDTTELGTRDRIFGPDINNVDKADAHGYPLYQKAMDNFLLDATDPTFASITSGASVDVKFPQGTSHVNQIKIQPHGGSNKQVEQPVAEPGTPYSYAFAVALSINPLELFKLITADTGFAAGQSATVKLQLTFKASNIGGTN